MRQDNMERKAEGGKRAFFGVPAKWIVTVGQLICIFALIFSFGILMLLENTGMAWDEIGESKTYIETSDCGSKMFQYMLGITHDLKDARRFEKEGELNAEQHIDITDQDTLNDPSKMFDESKMNPDTTYTLKQLQKMLLDGHADFLDALYTEYEYKKYEGYGTYNNYYYSRMSRDYLEDEGAEYTKEQIESAVAAALNDDAKTDFAPSDRVAGTEQRADEKEEELQLTSSEIELAQQIQEASGESVTVFSDEFLYLFSKGRAIELREERPLAGSTLAEYAAKHRSEVSLQELYQQLRDASYKIRDVRLSSQILEDTYGNTNLRFYIKDAYGNIYTNVAEWKNDANVVDRKDENSGLSLWFQRKDGMIIDLEQKGQNTAAGRYLKNVYSEHVMMDRDETVFLGLDTSFPNYDDIYQAAVNYDRFVPWVRMLVIIAVISCVMWLILLVIGTIQSGRNAYNGEIRLYGFDRIPTEVAAVLGMIVYGLAIFLAVVSFSACVVNEMGVWIFVLQAVVSVCCYGCCLAFYYGLIRRIKGKNLWTNSLIHSIVSLCKNVYVARSTSTRLILVFGGLVALHIILIGGLAVFGIFLCLLGDAVVLLYMLREASGRQTVLEGLQQIGSGDLDYKVDTANLTGDNLQFADTVNQVGEGLQAAVKERMKSERLKADLITNVSHDIKTPLTSIINYVDLLKRENIQDSKVKGYIDILDAKSQRLKQLTEDLVEASKVSSGNVKLEFVTLNLNELVQQMNGEIDERFAKRDLSIVTKLPRESLRISADGRSIWRVLENLYGNVAKYAMPGTRVYVETGKREGKIFFTIKNISEHPLNIDADELTERFIRGDVSRSTEGSGLGLSIAQNLTRLQHGEFHIYLDGDLFKVTLTFDEVPELKTQTESSKLEPEQEKGSDIVKTQGKTIEKLRAGIEAGIEAVRQSARGKDDEM